MKPLARFIIVPALPAALTIIGFVIGGIAGLFEPTVGFGWGGIVGAVFGGIIGKFVAHMLIHAGI